MVTHWTEYDVDLLFLTKFLNFLKINLDPWSVLIVLGSTCKDMYFLSKLFTDLAVVLDVICADGNFENRSTHMSMYFLFPNLRAVGRQSLIQFLEVFQGYHVLSVASNFHLLSHTRYNFLYVLEFLCRFSATRFFIAN